MKIEQYCAIEGDEISFSREQASLFAKAEAGDFNPIHDIDARRFCVPGDLLFSVVLHLAGLYESMSFEFLQLVTDTHKLRLVQVGNKFLLVDKNERVFMEVVVEGERTGNSDAIEALIRAYIEFSGYTFPYLLVDLFKKNDVMINPSRPLVMYKSMMFTLEENLFEKMTLEYSGGKLSPYAKKATVDLPFNIQADGREIGHGSKNMVLGGLRAYDDAEIDALVCQYNQIKDNYK